MTIDISNLDYFREVLNEVDVDNGTLGDRMVSKIHVQSAPSDGECWRSVQGQCWVWTGGKQAGGYGTLTAYGSTRLAHRVAFSGVHGVIAEGLEVDHLCRIRACVNPSHLEAVSVSENRRRSSRGLDLNGKCRAGLHDVRGVGSLYARSDGVRRCRACHDAARGRDASRNALVMEAARRLGMSRAKYVAKHGWSVRNARAITTAPEAGEVA